MSIEDRFKQPVISTLAKRAANRCSNPDCGAITSGPTDNPNDSVNVGEAAHIYGANPGSARYDPDMISGERSAITNAIWLCGNCHKLIDDDSSRYPAGLLFEWQREHEKHIAKQVGKVAAEIRQRYEKRHLEEFGRLSYLAERIILEKGDYWEYQLTAEVLRSEIAPILQRWRALKRGLYVIPTKRIEKYDYLVWMSDRMNEIQKVIHAISELTNVEFASAWGMQGVAGSDTDIITTCRLYAEVCKSTLAWEESVRFVRVDDIFNELQNLLFGIAGDLIEKAATIPNFLTDVISSQPKTGTHSLVLTIELPDGWTEKIHEAMARVSKLI